MANLGILEEDDEFEDEDDPENDEDKSVIAQERKEKVKKNKVEFQKWLKRVFRPSNQIIVGEFEFNPDLYFHLTKLSPGYIGGLINIFYYT